MSYQYDAASRRTRITWPDAFYAVYDYDVAGAVTAIRENGATSGAGVLATYAYDDLGRRTSLTRGNGVVTSYAYDSASRLDTLTHNLAGASHDQTYDFSYNAAFQALARDGSNSAYDWTPLAPGATSYADNGLNQYTSVCGASFTYDGRGNLTNTGATTYGYDVYNRLTSAGGATLSYDPVGRLYQTVGGGVTTRFAYDGLDLIGEYNTSGALLRRYVHGPSFDEPLVWYEGAGASDRRWLTTDQLGSVVAVTNASGAATSINTYDEYGVPGSSNAGRFQYTGQAWIAEAALHHYKARAYSPALGRFLQADPILYGGGMNLYVYVGNTPIGAVDPLGLQDHPGVPDEDIVVVAPRCTRTPIGTNWCEVGDFTRVLLLLDRPIVQAPPPIPEIVGGVSEEIVLTVPRREPRCGVGVGLRWPDFLYFEATVPVFVFGGGGISYTQDRYGQFYAGPVGGLGVPTGGGAQIMVGWMNRWETPTPAQLSGFLTEWGFSLGVAGPGPFSVPVGSAYVWNSSGSATLLGLSSPGLSAQAAYNFTDKSGSKNPCS